MPDKLLTLSETKINKNNLKYILNFKIKRLWKNLEQLKSSI
jgi:hypothetical protein